MGSTQSAQLKLARANRHIRDLETLCESFLAEHPHGIVCEKDLQAGIARVKLAVRRSLPMEASTILGDAVHNLRSSLDHLAVAAIRANGHALSRQTGFPVCGTEAELKNAIRSKLLGASTAFARYVAQVKPYRDGGDNVIFNLSRIDNMDKHEMLIPHVAIHEIHNVRITLRTGDNVLDLVGGTIAARGGSFNVAEATGGLPTTADTTLEVNSDAYASFQIEFHNAGVLEGLPVIETLKRFHARCSDVINNAQLRHP